MSMLAFPDVLGVMGELAHELTQIDLPLRAKHTLWVEVLGEAGWTRDQYSKALVSWLRLEEITIPDA